MTSDALFDSGPIVAGDRFFDRFRTLEGRCFWETYHDRCRPAVNDGGGCGPEPHTTA